MFDAFECTAEDETVMSRFLQQLDRGEFHDHVAPLGILRSCVGDSAIDADVLRQQLADELSKACGLDGLQVWLRSAEEMQRENLGSSSTRNPFSVRRADGKPSLEEKFELYFAPRDGNPHLEAADYASNQVAKLWPKGRARLLPMPLDDAVCSFRRDTNFGFPRCTTDHEANLHYYYMESCRMAEIGFPLADASDYPCVGTTRTKAAGFHQVGKDRALSMYCRAVMNHEKRVQAPLFRVLKELDQFPAWRKRNAKGESHVDVAVTRVLDSAPGEVLSVDFTSFDVTVPFYVLNRVFSIVASWFSGESKFLIRFLAEAFMRSGIYLPSGYLHGTDRTGGIPSGSGLTNLIGSLVNLWVFHYAVFRDNRNARVEHSLVNGDDGVYTFSGVSSIKKLSEILFDELGMLVKMDPAKNLISGKHVKFLQMEHHVDYRVEGLMVGIRPVMRTLISMTGMERRVPVKRLGLRDEPPTRWSGIFNTFRWLQQMEANSNHPKFEEFVLWYWDKDEKIAEALDAIIRGDAVVEIACAMLSVEDGEGGEILSLKSFRRSKIVRKLCELCGTQVP